MCVAMIAWGCEREAGYDGLGEAEAELAFMYAVSYTHLRAHET